MISVVPIAFGVGLATVQVVSLWLFVSRLKAVNRRWLWVTGLLHYGLTFVCAAMVIDVLNDAELLSGIVAYTAMLFLLVSMLTFRRNWRLVSNG